MNGFSAFLSLILHPSSVICNGAECLPNVGNTLLEREGRMERRADLIRLWKERRSLTSAFLPIAHYAPGSSVS